MAASFDFLSSAYVSSNTTSINFSSISQAYDDLYFIWSGKQNNGNTTARSLTIKFNNVSSNYYFSGGLYKNLTSISYMSAGYQYGAELGHCVPSRGNYNFYPNNFGVCELWLNEYATSGKTASGMFMSGCHSNAPDETNFVYANLGSMGTTNNFTAAITQVTFGCEGYSFEPGTKVWMYGLKSS